MLFRSGRAARLAAIDRSQAMIEFRMDGIIVTANRKFLELTGYALAEIRGRHHSLFLDPVERESPRFTQLWEELRHGKPQAGEFRRIAKGGRELWVEASHTPIKNLFGKPVRVVTLAADITEDRQRTAEFEGQMRAIDASQAVVTFGLDGTILDANARFLDVMGYALDEIRGRHHSLFMPATARDSAEYRAFWQSLARGEFQSGEFMRLGKGGREVWIQASYNPILDASGRPLKVVKLAADITEEKRRNLAFRGQVEAIGRSQAVIEFALDGTILVANDLFLNLMGYTLDELRGRHHRLFVPPDAATSQDYARFWASLGRGEFQSGEFMRVAKGGREVWIQATYNPIFDPSGRPLRVVKFATDITAMVAARRQMRLLSLVADETDNSVVITSPDGLIEYVNAGFSRMTGYTAQEAIGRRPGELLQGEHTDPEARARLRQHLIERKPFYGEILNYTKQGQPYWISLSINPVCDGDGVLQRYVSIQANITDTKRDAVQRSVRLDAIGLSNAFAEWSLDGRLVSANAYLRALGVDLDPARCAASTLLGDAGGRALHGESVHCELEWPSQDGFGVHLDARLSLLRDIQDRPERVLMSAVDVTLRQRAMQKATEALAEALAASRKISAISATIATLARQTNLLSLNATIESARAGESGRGFAVVASEVRSLAMRSAGSSSEIDGLARDSQERIGTLAVALERMTTNKTAEPGSRLAS